MTGKEAYNTYAMYMESAYKEYHQNGVTSYYRELLDTADQWWWVWVDIDDLSQ